MDTFLKKLNAHLKINRWIDMDNNLCNYYLYNKLKIRKIKVSNPEHRDIYNLFYIFIFEKTQDKVLNINDQDLTEDLFYTFSDWYKINKNQMHRFTNGIDDALDDLDEFCGEILD